MQYMDIPVILTYEPPPPFFIFCFNFKIVLRLKISSGYTGFGITVNRFSDRAYSENK